MKKSNQNQEEENAENQPKRMKQDDSIPTSKLDQFEATNYLPNISAEEIATAKSKLEVAPKELDLNGLRDLYLETRVLQRRMLQDPIKYKISEQILMFPWLKNVSFILLL